MEIITHSIGAPHAMDEAFTKDEKASPFYQLKPVNCGLLDSIKNERMINSKVPVTIIQTDTTAISNWGRITIMEKH